MALVTGSVTLLSRCGFGEERLPIALNNLNVTVEQEDLLKAVVSAVIPQTDIPGAESLEVHNFVWVMADDCLDKKTQDQFMSGLNGFDKFLKHSKEKSFSEFEAVEQTGILEEVMTITRDYEVPADNEGNPEFNITDIQYFVGRTKGFTIQGFMNSQFVMTDIMPYKLVPGPASGCIVIDPNKRINING